MLRLAALIAAVGTMLGCGRWKQRVGEAVTIDLLDDQSRLAAMLDCWLPADWHGEYSFRLRGDVRIADVRVLGEEGDEARRYQADVELAVDPVPSVNVRGISSEPVRLTVAGVATHETKLRFMYIVPWVFSETRTQVELISRNGIPVSIDQAARGLAPEQAAPNRPRLERGASFTGSFANTIEMAPENAAYTQIYDELAVPVRAGEEVRLKVISQLGTPIAAWLAPPPDAYLSTLAARIIPARGSAELRYQSPAAGELRLFVWKMRDDPAGQYVVSR